MCCILSQQCSTRQQRLRTTHLMRYVLQPRGVQPKLCMQHQQQRECAVLRHVHSMKAQHCEITCAGRNLMQSGTCALPQTNGTLKMLCDRRSCLITPAGVSLLYLINEPIHLRNSGHLEHGLGGLWVLRLAREKPQASMYGKKQAHILGHACRLCPAVCITFA